MSIVVSDVTGRKVATIGQDKALPGVNEVSWKPGREWPPASTLPHSTAAAR